MKCPYCSKLDNKVIDSRLSKDGRTIRRRRECTECGRRFTTYEKLEEVLPMIVKKDGRREPFDLEKLEAKVRVSLVKRPVPQPVVQEMIESIEDEAALAGKPAGEISSKDLGEMVLKRLYDVDRVAYVRFASVYRMFDNVDEFLQEISRLTK